MRRIHWIFNVTAGRYETFLDGRLYFVADTVEEFFQGWRILNASL